MLAETKGKGAVGRATPSRTGVIRESAISHSSPTASGSRDWKTCARRERVGGYESGRGEGRKGNKERYETGGSSKLPFCIRRAVASIRPFIRHFIRPSVRQNIRCLIRTSEPFVISSVRRNVETSHYPSAFVERLGVSGGAFLLVGGGRQLDAENDEEATHRPDEPPGSLHRLLLPACRRGGMEGE